MAAVLTVLGLLTPPSGTRETVSAQEIGARGGLSRLANGFDDPEAERLFREYERLTRMREPEGMPPVRMRPRLKGDFWLPDDQGRLVGK